MKKGIIYVLIVLLVVISIVSFVAHKNMEEKKNIKEYVTIKYEAEENDFEDKTIEKGSTIGTLPTPTLPGFKFLYWTLDDKEIDESFIVNDNITLKAKFEEIKLTVESYVVVFNTDGAAEIENQVINKGDKVVKPEDPVKKGYIFLYWTYKDVEYDFEKPVTSDLALRAYYKRDNTNDKTAPVIELTGEETITLKVGDSYTEPGYTSIDDYDGDITDKVVKTGNVDTSTAGTYTITYTSTDEKGNTSSKTRTIVVE